jgi:peptide deformylase
MPTREIVVYDDPTLRKKSRRVKNVSDDVQRLIDDMVETMHEANGIGLAAIQVGVPQRVIVVQLPEAGEDEENPDPNAGRLFAVVNPRLARRSRETEEGIEGCLSVPGLVGDVERCCAVTVKGLDRRGKRVRVRAQDLLARVFQHEIDHCDGVLFIDHIDDPEKLYSVTEGEEEAAEAAQKVPATQNVPSAQEMPIPKDKPPRDL